MDLTHITKAAKVADEAAARLKRLVAEAVAAGATITAASDAAGGVARSTLYRWINEVGVSSQRTARAREAFRQAGGDPEHADELAAWAISLTEKTAGRGVLITQDGRIVAHTQTASGQGPQPRYITEDDRQRLGLDVSEVGIVSARLQAEYGPTVHVADWQVT